VGDLGLGPVLVAPQQGGQAHAEGVVPGLLAPTFNVLA
jgi:hypothetical protein